LVDTRLLLDVDPGPYNVGDTVGIRYDLQFFSRDRNEWMTGAIAQDTHITIHVEKSFDGITWIPVGTVVHKYDPVEKRTSPATGSFTYKIPPEDAGKKIFVRMVYHGCNSLYHPGYPDDWEHMEGSTSETKHFYVEAPPTKIPIWVIVGVGALATIALVGLAWWVSRPH